MPSIAIRLDPERMENPDLDIRYRLPELLSEKSNGLIKENGYDYGYSHRENPYDSPALILFLHADDLPAAIPIVLEVMQHTIMLENTLRNCAIVGVAVPDNADDEKSYRVIFPPDYAGGMSFA